MGTRSRSRAPSTPAAANKGLEIYAEHTERLLASGAAYYCFCSPETLEAERAAG